jgi:hypothetical protein
MIALPGVALAAPGDAVSIPDTSLREAVKAAVGHQPDNLADPTEGEMASITNLNLSGRNVTDLTGIQYATALTSLNLSGNAVTDITPLTTLTGLVTLDLSLTPVTTIEPLAGKTALASLDLTATNSNETAAETTFSTLTGLEFLDLSSTDLTEEAAAATSVIELIIDDNLATNLDGYEALTNLRALYADNNPFENLDGLKGKNLDYLGAGVTQVRDLSGITAQNGRVLTEVPLSAGVGEDVDLTVTGVGTTGQVELSVAAGTYDPDEQTVSYPAAGAFQASWNQLSGESFQFTGNLNIEVAATAPSGVTDFDVSGRIASANLNWALPNTNGLGDIDEYTIVLSNDGFVTSTQVSAPGDATSLVIPDLEGGNYTARITYTTTEGALSPESTAAFTVYAEPFPVPGNVDASYIEASDSIGFRWTGGAPSYILTVTDDMGETTEFTVNDTSITIPASEFADPARLTFTVEAGDDQGSLGAVSTPTVINTETGYVGPVTVGAAVTNVVAGEMDAERMAVPVSFDVPEGTQNVRYTYDGGAGIGLVTAFETLEAGPNTIYIPVRSGQEYSVVIAARTESSDYVAAPAVEFEAPELGSVTGLVGTLGDGNVTLNWNPVAGAASYEVTVILETTQTPVFIPVDGTTATLTFSDFPANNEQYEIGVRAVDANGGKGLFSTILEVNPGAEYVGPSNGMLPAPTNLASTYNAADNTFTFTWTGDAAADRYILSMNGMDYLADEPTLTVSAGAAGTEYDVIVYQRAIGGQYGPGTSIDVVTPDDGPVVPSELSGVVVDGDVVASWPAIPGAVSYEVGIGDLDRNSGDLVPVDGTSVTVPDGATRTFILTVAGLNADGEQVQGTSYQGIWNAGGTEFLELTPPPAGIEVGTVTATDEAVTVDWEAIDADFYRVMATNGTETLVSPVLTGDVSSYAFDRAAFAPGSTWTFTVTARDASSVWSAPAGAELAFPADGGSGDGGSGDGSGDGGSGDGSGDGTGATAGDATGTDPIKQSGEGDLSLLAGGLLVAAGAGLMVAPLVRRKKGLAGANAS